jgi:hypothetical protein
MTCCARTCSTVTPPENPDLVLDTAGANIDDLVVQVIAVLNERSPRNNR